MKISTTCAKAVGSLYREEKRVVIQRVDVATLRLTLKDSYATEH
jgi:hypothetical protein